MHPTQDLRDRILRAAAKLGHDERSFAVVCFRRGGWREREVVIFWQGGEFWFWSPEFDCWSPKFGGSAHHTTPTAKVKP